MAIKSINQENNAETGAFLDVYSRPYLTQTQEAILTEWLKRLRDPETKQCYMSLSQREMSGKQSFCCLGVLCDAAGYTWEYTDWRTSRLMLAQTGGTGSLPTSFARWLRISPNIESILTQANDREGKTFPEIADMIEKELKLKKQAALNPTHTKDIQS